MNKKRHITITDNETGETLQDADTCAIIGGYVVDDGSVGILCVHCHLIDHAKAVHAAERVIERSYQEHPELKLATLLAAAGSTTEEVEH